MEMEPFSSFGKEKGGTEMIGGRVYTLSFLSQGSPKKNIVSKKKERQHRATPWNTFLDARQENSTDFAVAKQRLKRKNKLNVYISLCSKWLKMIFWGHWWEKTTLRKHVGILVCGIYHVSYKIPTSNTSSAIWTLHTSETLDLLQTFCHEHWSAINIYIYLEPNWPLFWGLTFHFMGQIFQNNYGSFGF